MVKEVFFFTEMGYTAYSQEVAASYGYTSLMLPNENFVPQKAKQLYDMYFEEHQQAVEVGFDGVMINEHHNNPLSMMASINVIGGMLAKALAKGKIVFLGNVLPIHENPVRIAEELAIVDVISGGRVISGFVRGVGQETLATNINPVHNRERFEEAHDLIIKTWTTPGPFRWEGKHYNLRVVNPWVLPMQKPHPPIWIPGVSSPETIEFAAQHKYPYIALAPPLELAKGIYDIYHKAAVETGYEDGPENRGYAVRAFVADSDEAAYEEGKKFYWQLGTSFGVAPRHWQAPPGHMSRTAAASPQEAARDAARAVTTGGIGYDEAHATYQIITGNPDTVTRKLKDIVDVVDPASLIIWGREGPITHDSASRCIDLLGKEVLPAIKEYQTNGRG